MSDRDTISRLRSDFVKAFNEENIEALSVWNSDLATAGLWSGAARAATA
jgi:hypothetical protein